MNMLMDVVHQLPGTAEPFYEFFAKNLRPGLFTAFLTISGFLLSAHTFIVIHMKKELYETETYRARVAQRRANKVGSKQYYGPLRRLSKLLMWTIGMSLAASFFQVTLGLYEKSWSAVACLAMALMAFLLLVASVAVMGCNLRRWFEELEEREKNVGLPPMPETLPSK